MEGIEVATRVEEEFDETPSLWTVFPFELQQI